MKVMKTLSLQNARLYLPVQPGLLSTLRFVEEAQGKKLLVQKTCGRLFARVSHCSAEVGHICIGHEKRKNSANFVLEIDQKRATA